MVLVAAVLVAALPPPVAGVLVVLVPFALARPDLLPCRRRRGRWSRRRPRWWSRRRRRPRGGRRRRRATCSRRCRLAGLRHGRRLLARTVPLLASLGLRPLGSRCPRVSAAT